MLCLIKCHVNVLIDWTFGFDNNGFVLCLFVSGSFTVRVVYTVPICTNWQKLALSCKCNLYNFGICWPSPSYPIHTHWKNFSTITPNIEGLARQISNSSVHSYVSWNFNKKYLWCVDHTYSKQWILKNISYFVHNRKWSKKQLC